MRPKQPENTSNDKIMLLMNNGPVIFIWKRFKIYNETIFKLFFKIQQFIFSPQWARI